MGGVGQDHQQLLSLCRKGLQIRGHQRHEPSNGDERWRVEVRSPKAGVRCEPEQFLSSCVSRSSSTRKPFQSPRCRHSTDGLGKETFLNFGVLATFIRGTVLLFRFTIQTKRSLLESDKPGIFYRHRLMEESVRRSPGAMRVNNVSIYTTKIARHRQSHQPHQDS